MNILVSGVAGDIGLGAGRILRECKWPGLLYGIDIQKNHAGIFVFDFCCVAPKASDLNYLDWISYYIKANNINIFIPTSEAEIKIISDKNIKEIANAKIIISNKLVVEKSLDKYECLNFLSFHNIQVPKNGLVKLTEPENYPVIVKPRTGQGSKDIVKVINRKEFFKHSESDSVWQEYLSPEDEEYTCPVFRSKKTGTRILILKRKLEYGITVSGIVVDSKEIYCYVEKIANALNLLGFMNVQLRLTPKGPLLFEINPRLSSTLVFRDKMGFKDLKWSIEMLTEKSISSYTPPQAGTRFYLGAKEYIQGVACE